MSQYATSLRLESYRMPAASLGGENPLPPYPFIASARLPPPEVIGPDDPQRGPLRTIHPYRNLDQYDRNRSPRNFKVAVLENESLRATFLLELGGRLWSLYHKPSDTELLHVNPVFQPAHLAVRDAWFSGGVEWNIGLMGHSPFTCAPLFAAAVADDDGSPMLRLYEWERARCVPFQLDFALPPGSPFLLLRGRIANPQPHAVPMYWWSNIATDEKPGLRVLSPAASAARHQYDGNIVYGDLPLWDGIDMTYPDQRLYSGDLYFRIPTGQRPWIASLDSHGRGLIHTSTDRMIGRKMYVWGASSGGRRWQEYLADANHAYIEIQGGFTERQGQIQIMPAGAQWCWMEAYGLMEADPSRVHAGDWNAACQAVAGKLEEMLPRRSLHDELGRRAPAARRPPHQILNQASGWAALELQRLLKSGQPSWAGPATPFPDSTIGPDQTQWARLLDDGQLPYVAPGHGPGTLMVQPQWRLLLEAALAAGRGDHWLSWFHVGLMRRRDDDVAGARSAFEFSNAREPNLWATRELGILARDVGDYASWASFALSAVGLDLNCAPMAAECALALNLAGRYADTIVFIDSLPTCVANRELVRLYRAMAALHIGDLDHVQRFLDRLVSGEAEPASVREGDVGLADLWLGLQEKRLAAQLGTEITLDIRRRVREEFPVPHPLDFRQRVREI